MKIRTKIIIAFLFFTIPVLFMGISTFLGLNTLNNKIKTGIEPSINSIEKTVNLNSIAQFIRYYDEVLTQSTRSYVYTSDIKWKERYNVEAPKLDSHIKDAISLGTEEDKQLFLSADSANLALVKMEETAMKLVDQGNNKEAIKILESSEYAEQKDIYQKALVRYSEIQGNKYDDVLTTSVSETINSIKTIENSFQASIIWTIVGIVLSIIIAFIFSIIFTQIIAKPLSILSQVTKEIAVGNLGVDMPIKSKDEVGELADSFKQMTINLKESRSNIEEKIAQRTAELEKLNKVMVGREIKMIELKKEIEKLQGKGKV